MATPVAPSTEDDPFQAAATEVIDSLEPYIVAAKQGDRPIPVDHLLRPFVAGILLEYCGAALEIARGGDAVASREDRARVDQCLMRSPRFLAHFARSDLAAADALLADKSTRAKVVVGQVFGRGMLEAFASREDPKKSVLFSRLVGNLNVPSWELPQLASPPPATRLHPHGPHAELVQRALLARFTRALIDPEAGLE